MKTLIKCMILIFLAACSGTYSRFRLTGVPYSPLPENKEINVVQSGDNNKYEEIGIAEVKNSSREARINEAKRLARKNGGEAIMPLPHENEEKADVEEFRVLMPLPEDITEKPVEEEKPVEIKPEPIPAIKEKPNYGNLSAVPYKILVGEFPNLTGEKFRDSMYALKFVKVPKDLSAEKNSRLVQLETKKGGNSVYLIINKDRVNEFKNIIKSGKKTKFAYTPVVLYQGRVPVLKLIDVIE